MEIELVLGRSEVVFFGRVLIVIHYLLGCWVSAKSGILFVLNYLCSNPQSVPGSIRLHLAPLNFDLVIRSLDDLYLATLAK